MVKKLIAVFLTLSIFFSNVLTVFSYSEKNAAAGEIYFKKDFEDEYYGTIKPFANLTMRESGNIVSTALEENGNRYMVFEKRAPDYQYASGEGNSNFEKILSNAKNEKKIVIQFDVRPQDATTLLYVQISESSTKMASFSLKGNQISGKDTLSFEKWTTVRAFLDFSSISPTMTVYAGNKEIVKSNINISAFWRVRFHSEKTFSAGKFCFDNFVIYSGEPIFDDSVYDLKYKSIVRADATVIPNVSAVSSRGDYYIGGVKGCDPEFVKCENGVILLSYKKLCAFYGKNTDDNSYIPYNEALAMIGKMAVYDDRGFVYWFESDDISAISDEEKWDLHNILAYERPSAEYLNDNVKKTHPRLGISDERINEVKNEILENTYSKWYYNTAKTRVEKIYNEALLNDPSNNSNVMMKARSLKSRVKNLILWYYLMEDSSQADAKDFEKKDKVKDRIWQNIEAVINYNDFPHWQPDSGLDNAEMAAAVAYAYDWFYYELTKEQRKQIEEALYKKALVYAAKNYGGQIEGNSSWWVNTKNSNQNAVINGGYALCALALMDIYPNEAGIVLEKAIRSTEHFQNSFFPDGAWLEGVTYLTYSMQFWIPMVMSIKESYGTTFGMLRAPGIEKSPEYIMYTSSINEIYNYHDSEPNRTVYYTGYFYGLSRLYNEPLWADWKLTCDLHHKVYYDFETLLNFPVTAKKLDNIDLPKEAEISRDSIGSFRESWVNPDGMFLCYHGGQAYPGHGHCDSGSFVYEYDGVRFGIDLPSETYSISGDNRLKSYRVRPEGHNCLVINPDDTPGQKTNVFSPNERFERNDYGGFGILNMSALYADYASEVKRGFKTDDNRNSMIIRDEIKGVKTGGKIYWFMHTYASTKVEIKDSNTAVLTSSGKSVKLEFFTDAKKFELKVMPAEPFDTTPKLSGQLDNSMYKKIAFIADCEANSDVVIQAKLSPLANDIISAENIPLSQWKTDEIVKLSEIDNGKFRAEIAKKDLFAFTALYKGEELYRVVAANNNSYDGMTIECQIPEENDISAKVFVWESKQNIAPMIETIPLNTKNKAIMQKKYTQCN